MMATIPGTAAPDRIVTLDVIRGIAVMGIFSVNVIAFAMIEPAYFNPSAGGGYHGVDLATWAANYILIDGKMRSLFSMLFGASMLLVIERAEASGRSAGGVHYARMIVLALFGLAHFYLVWFGDILFSYAVTGMVAFALRRKPVRAMLIWSAALFVVSAAMFASSAAYFRDLDIAAHSPAATPAQIAEWNQAVAPWGMMLPERAAEETAIARSGFAERAAHMIRDRGAEPFVGAIFFLPETLALMLLGMACFKGGYFTGGWSDRAYRRAAAWGIGIGGIAFAVLARVNIASHFYLPVIFFDFFALGTPFRVGMALGYAALIVLIFRKPSAIRDRFAAVGRSAFTNYLGTSILAMLIFNGDGLALFGTLSRFEAWLFVPLFWLIMLLWSKPWLDRFQYGPFEWLWRSLSRGSLQPMRRRAALAST
jgi:uncharacterized protein